MKEWVGKHYNTIQKPRLEGDDCLGLLATCPGNECIVVSSDKDLKTIPGKLYRPEDDELLEISLEEADRFFLTQTLTGDVTDGYKDVPVSVRKLRKRYTALDHIGEPLNKRTSKLV